MMYLLLAVLSYLFGAVPFGFLVARARGVDIRSVGSGNIGATNVFRTVGKGWGILTLLLDALKGYIPAAVFPAFLSRATGCEAGNAAPVVFACLAVAGHNWPVYLRFKGGKGIATTAGALLGIAPAALGVGVCVWVAAFVLTRYVSVASILAALAVPASAWCFYRSESLLIPIMLTVLGMAAVIRHHTNIKRLIDGTESKITFGKKTKTG